MYNFKYIDPIKNAKGKLRDWKDYDWLSRLEKALDNNQPCSTVFLKHEFIENERSKIQR